MGLRAQPARDTRHALRRQVSAVTLHAEHGRHGPRPASRRRLMLPQGHLVLTIVLGIALVALLIAHRQPVFSGGVLAIALVAACLLLHPLLHRAHGHQGGASERQDDQP